MIEAEEAKRLITVGMPTLVAFERPRRDIGFHFVDQVAREARTIAGIEGLTAQSYTVRSTINPQLQRAAEAALQEGSRATRSTTGRVQNSRPPRPISAEAIRRIEAQSAGATDKPAWQQALDQRAAAALRRALAARRSWSRRAQGGNVQVGLADGRVVPLHRARGNALRSLKLNDVDLCPRRPRPRRRQGQGANVARAELRVRPTVQGAAVVLENQTGRILAMAGGFSYPLSQLNRVTQSQRQPGSSLKPLTYLAALRKGLQPNTLVRDEPVTLPPIGGANARTRAEDYWSPKNYDGGGGGIMTLRRALENSQNLATAHLLDGGIDIDAGAQPRPDLRARDGGAALSANACATIRSCSARSRCGRSISRRSTPRSPTRASGRRRTRSSRSSRTARSIYRHPATSAARIGSADGVAFYQLKTILQGVLPRGTAAPDRRARALCRRQDRHHRRRERRLVRRLHQRRHGRGLGRLRQCRRPAPHARRRRDRRQRRGADLRADHAGGLGASRAADGAARPSPETRKSGGRDAGRRRPRRRSRDCTGDRRRARGTAGTLVEYLRRDARGQPVDTQYRLVSRDDQYDAGGRRDDRSGGGFDFFFGGGPRRLCALGAVRHSRSRQPFGQQCAAAAAAAVPATALAGGTRTDGTCAG